MTIRDWLAERLNEPAALPMGVLNEARKVGEHGLRIARHTRPDVVVWCPEPSEQQVFSCEDLRSAVAEIPDLDMVVIVRRRVDPDVYGVARELGVVVEKFNDLKRALIRFDDASQYVHSEVEYVEGRLRASGAVSEVVRIGHRAWRIIRVRGLSALTVVGDDRYEVTSDAVIQVLSEYAPLSPSIVVATNPNTSGLAPRVAQTAERAGVRVLLMSELLSAIPVL